MTDANKKNSGFSLRFKNKSKQAPEPLAHTTNIPTQQSTTNRNKLRKKQPASQYNNNLATSTNTDVAIRRSEQARARADLEYDRRQPSFPTVDVSKAFERDKQTGELIDHTDLLHNLIDHDISKVPTVQARPSVSDGTTRPGKLIVAKLKPSIWMQIIRDVSLADAASIAFSCKDFLKLLGHHPWNALRNNENSREKLEFLMRMDEQLPGHLLCFTCTKFHTRIQRGTESLKPANIANPIYNCPYASNPKTKIPRVRLTFGRTLPFPFVQLATRAHKYSSDYGVTTESLSRRYKDREPSTWSHQTRYAIIDGHLIMRVTSQTFATAGLPPAGLRHLLYSREDFVPYFSVCEHWRDGELMPLVKCALSHIPKPLEGSGVNRLAKEIELHMHRQSPIVSLCHQCRPMRRCPECPTEYLIEIRMAEDKSDPVNVFKQALIVTRWSDLGDGSSPWSPEWAACNGEAEFDSLKALGKRAISGKFESHVNGDAIPGQMILSLNPNNEKKGEAGHKWY